MLHLHRAERADRLAEALAHTLREAPADVFTPDVVAVPAKGVERWLAQRLSHHLGDGGLGDGVCANVQFRPLTDVIAEAAEAGGGPSRDADPWHPARLVWTLLDVIDQCAHERWCSALGGYLGRPGDDPVRQGRRYATARHIAVLYQSYGLHRPGMVRSWLAGDDTDGLGAALPIDLAWQAELWRRLRKQVAAPSPPELLPAVCAALRERPGTSALPQRLSFFGPTGLPAAHVAILSALAGPREVHLWVPHPSPVLWDRLKQRSPGVALPVARVADPTADVARSPLLRSLGRDVRELQVLLSAAGVDDRHHELAYRPATLLGRVQAAIAADELPEPGSLDRSVQVHACHGGARQVEVLREVVLGLLAADPTLEPRDILVMCPDIETFAPLLSASFGLGDQSEHPGHRLRVRLADRALLQVNPLLATVAQLFELAESRLTAAQVLDFAGSAPVRRRFRFSDDDLERLRDLVVGSGVRWGLDVAHRARFQLGTIGSNTWSAGLDRILLGVAMSEDDDQWLATALPLDDVDSSDADLAGRLAELVDRLGAALAAFTGDKPLTAWLDALTTALDELTAVGPADSWQASQVQAEFADVAAAAAGHAVDVRLALADVRSLLADRLRGRPTRANFRTGDLTMCTMVPMRSVPHRVVCLLGLDDGVFPRSAGEDGDDVLARNPCVGERDVRSEDRQLLLDAVLAATSHLVIVHTGADERTNARRAPAVPLNELLDVIDVAVGGREGVVVRHPLQPFDARNFVSGALGEPGPLSFDGAALAGALMARGPRRADEPFLSGPLPPAPPEDPIALDDLRRFAEHPVRSFLRRRFGLTYFSDDADPGDGLPVELGPLESWAVGDRLLRARLGGGDPHACAQAEWRRGTVPPGALGRRVLTELAAEVEPVVEAVQPFLAGEPEVAEVQAVLPDGRRITGIIPGVYGDAIVAAEYSKLSPKHRLRAWVRLLTLTVSRPDRPWRAVTVCRGKPGESTLGPVDAGAAAEALADLVALYDDGATVPLPLLTKSSHAFASVAGPNPEPGYAKARKYWSRFGGGGENEDAAHVQVWGPAAPFDVFLADDQFAELAVRLWARLFAAEVLR